MNDTLKSAFNREITVAKQFIARSELEQGFVYVERAHVLGQAFVVPHIRSHWLMLKVEILRRRPVAAMGQMARILLGSLGSAIGVVPVGNTGGSDISMFQRMPIAPDLLNIIEGRASGDLYTKG